jgi:hypothetical protein
VRVPVPLVPPLDLDMVIVWVPVEVEDPLSRLPVFEVVLP